MYVQFMYDIELSNRLENGILILDRCNVKLIWKQIKDQIEIQSCAVNCSKQLCWSLENPEVRLLLWTDLEASKGLICLLIFIDNSFKIKDEHFLSRFFNGNIWSKYAQSSAPPSIFSHNLHCTKHPSNQFEAHRPFCTSKIEKK